MIKIKIKKQKEIFIGGLGDYRQDTEFDPELLQMAIDKEKHDHGLSGPEADEIAKDEFTKDERGYTKEIKKDKASRKLSEYWRARARRRAGKGKRNWPNATDYNWALKEQAKSKKINEYIYELFEKELEANEEIGSTVKDLLEKLKKQRKQKMKVKKFGPGMPDKANKNLSRSYPPHEEGETVGGYYRKAAKYLGGAGAAPGEAIGPM